MSHECRFESTRVGIPQADGVVSIPTPTCDCGAVRRIGDRINPGGVPGKDGYRLSVCDVPQAYSVVPIPTRTCERPAIRRIGNRNDPRGMSRECGFQMHNIAERVIECTVRMSCKCRYELSGGGIPQLHCIIVSTGTCQRLAIRRISDRTDIYRKVTAHGVFRDGFGFSSGNVPQADAFVFTGTHNCGAIWRVHNGADTPGMSRECCFEGASGDVPDVQGVIRTTTYKYGPIGRINDRHNLSTVCHAACGGSGRRECSAECAGSGIP